MACAPSSLEGCLTLLFVWSLSIGFRNTSVQKSLQIKRMTSSASTSLSRSLESLQRKHDAFQLAESRSTCISSAKTTHQCAYQCSEVENSPFCKSTADLVPNSLHLFKHVLPSCKSCLVMVPSQIIVVFIY